jgi:hypothetical protein
MGSQRMAVWMNSGLADRFNAIEFGLEHIFSRSLPLDALEFWWCQCDIRYQATSFSRYFISEFDVKDINVGNSWNVNDFLPEKDYCRIFPNHGKRVLSKLNDGVRIFFKELVTFKDPLPESIRYDMGFHIRAYEDPARFCRKSEFLLHSVDLIKQIIGKYDSVYISSDAPEVLRCFDKNEYHKLTLSEVQKQSTYAGYGADELGLAVDDLQHLSRCDIVYRTVGGFGALAAAFGSGKCISILDLDF